MKNGHRPHQDGSQGQNYRCKTCGKQFNERIGTPLYRLQTPLSTLTLALKMRSEGMGIRASGRVLGKSHSNIIRWENRLAAQATACSPATPESADLTLEGDKLDTRVGENLLPPQNLEAGR